jgi:hypothetical protein
MVKRKKKDLFEKFFFGKPKKEKVKKVKIMKDTRITPIDIRKRLMTRRERTAQRILDSPFSSPIAKARARRILSQ